MMHVHLLSLIYIYVFIKGINNSGGQYKELALMLRHL